MTVCYHNGNYVNQADATISIMDRGFLFADSIYEVAPYLGGQSLGLQAHIDRLTRSLQGIHMTNPLSDTEWHRVIDALIEKNQLTSNDDFFIYIQVTRGHQPKRNHHLPAEYQPTVIAFPQTMPARRHSGPNKVITATDTRHAISHIKSTSVLANILHLHEAHHHDAIEALLFRDNHLVEGTHSNAMIVTNNTIKMPPLADFMLPGITRDIILTQARQAGIAVEECMISLPEVLNADEVWLTGSSRTITPVTQVDDTQINHGQVGPIFEKTLTLLLQQVQNQKDM